MMSISRKLSFCVALLLIASLFLLGCDNTEAITVKSYDNIYGVNVKSAEISQNNNKSVLTLYIEKKGSFSLNKKDETSTGIVINDCKMIKKTGDSWEVMPNFEHVFSDNEHNFLTEDGITKVSFQTYKDALIDQEAGTTYHLFIQTVMPYPGWMTLTEDEVNYPEVGIIDVDLKLQ